MWKLYPPPQPTVLILYHFFLITVVQKKCSLLQWMFKFKLKKYKIFLLKRIYGNFYDFHYMIRFIFGLNLSNSMKFYNNSHVTVNIKTGNWALSFSSNNIFFLWITFHLCINCGRVRKSWHIVTSLKYFLCRQKIKSFFSIACNTINC